MRQPVRLLVFSALAFSAFAFAVRCQDHRKPSSKILQAKSVYFDDKMGDAAVSNYALQELKKWGRFQIVKSPADADLVLMLSADPRKGGFIVFSGGQTGTLDKNGKIEEDPVPSFDKQAPTRYAYLTVFDAKTGENLWSAEHQWGGVLTGVHSAGARLVKKLRKEVEK